MLTQLPHRSAMLDNLLGMNGFFSEPIEEEIEIKIPKKTPVATGTYSNIIYPDHK